MRMAEGGGGEWVKAVWGEGRGTEALINPSFAQRVSSAGNVEPAALALGCRGRAGERSSSERGNCAPPRLVFLPAILPSLVPLNQEPLTPEPGVGFLKSRHI